jgi:hypothetical protein
MGQLSAISYRLSAKRRLPRAELDHRRGFFEEAQNSPLGFLGFFDFLLVDLKPLLVKGAQNSPQGFCAS